VSYWPNKGERGDSRVSTKVAIVGSGAGASTAAMVLAEAGFDVQIFEKGPNYVGDITQAAPPDSQWSSDELKRQRYFGRPHPESEPRTYRWSTADAKPRHVGDIQSLPQTVGGGTIHWGAACPRFWDIDFQKLSLLGPVPGADIVDWPFSYEEIAPDYDTIENLIGVQGDINQLPPYPTLAHAPRTHPLPMPPGPPQLSSVLLANGATKLGYHPFPVPTGTNSRPYDGRPACVNCGFCDSYGCPIHARVGALAPLRRAVKAGASLHPNAQVTAITVQGQRATGLRWLDEHGGTHEERADLVVLGCMAIESVRLALLSKLPDPNGTLGRHLMFHWHSDATGVFLSQRTHVYRGRTLSHMIDDFADPDFPGARDAARAAGLPYFRGGTLEMGGSQGVLDEASTYQYLLTVLQPDQPFGTAFKQLMRSSILRDRNAGCQLVAEDLAYPTNAVDLDPSVKDYRGFPVARITYSPGTHELTAQQFYLPYLVKLLQSAGADVATAVPEINSAHTPIAAGPVPNSFHVMGGMRMGTDPRISVTDSQARYHHLDNLVVADGSVFPSSGGHNPTNTIMTTALRNARLWAKAY
jgi:choline dehydrogenase-like flavoprotein